MLDKIQRYNQGFGGFGPLEQSATGKLMKAEDVLSYITELKKTQTQALVDNRRGFMTIAAASRTELLESFSYDVEALECLCKKWERLYRREKWVAHVYLGAFLGTLLYTLLKQCGVF